MKRFFIIGNPRSGTTLFRLMLNKHSIISVPPEAGFLVWLHNEFANVDNKIDYENIIASLKETQKIESWNLNFSDLENFLKKKSPNNYAETMNEIYEFYSKNILMKDVSLYGDKNNYYLNHIDLLYKLYPDAKFIHIIRDGRSIAASYQGLMKKNISSKYAPNLPINADEIAKEWISNIETIESSFKKLPKELVHTIRYEDLILAPEETLTLVSDFLDVKFEVSMLNYHETKKEDGLEPVEYMAWKSKNLEPINKEEVYKFKLLSTADRILFESIAKDKLNFYDYI